ncbi:MAG TPA: hypothetical protein VFK04_08600 [Gemmatimonadaceae bacterium]|nr:hypothetical protein [Gemmatimonadaceae bacterium]
MPRAWLERAAHAVALVLIVWLLVESLLPPAGRVDAADLGSLSEALARWSTVEAPERVQVRVDSGLSPTQRDWLVALGGADTRVGWNGAGLLPIAAVARPIPDPIGATGVWVAAPAGTSVILSDQMGTLDSVRSGAAGVRFVALSAPSAVRVRANPVTARSALVDSLDLKRVLVLGSTGWESKFVVASLEERGWKVDAHLVLSPKGDVVQGDASPLDTARYAAVVALDSTALRWSRKIVQYVRSGGGLVIEGALTATPSFAPLRVGKLGAAIAPATPFDSVPDEPRRALALRPITLGSAAVAVESRDSLVAVASRRVERGRVTVVGYEDTWRWRMGGGDGALQGHREWWSHLVASVADVGRATIEPTSPTDEAPLANLVDRLGPQTPATGVSDTRSGIPHAWLFAIVAALLLLEWTSRRLRGAP